MIQKGEITRWSQITEIAPIHIICHAARIAKCRRIYTEFKTFPDRISVKNRTRIAYVFGLEYDDLDRLIKAEAQARPSIDDYIKAQ